MNLTEKQAIVDKLSNITTYENLGEENLQASVSFLDRCGDLDQGKVQFTLGLIERIRTVRYRQYLLNVAQRSLDEATKALNAYIVGNKFE